MARIMKIRWTVSNFMEKSIMVYKGLILALMNRGSLLLKPTVKPEDHKVLERSPDTESQKGKVL